MPDFGGVQAWNPAESGFGILLSSPHAFRDVHFEWNPLG